MLYDNFDEKKKNFGITIHPELNKLLIELSIKQNKTISNKSYRTSFKCSFVRSMQRKIIECNGNISGAMCIFEGI